MLYYYNITDKIQIYVQLLLISLHNIYYYNTYTNMTADISLCVTLYTDYIIDNYCILKHYYNLLH